MSYFVIVDSMSTGVLYRKPGHYTETVYPTERGAKIAAAKLNKKNSTNRFVAVDYVEFKKSHQPKMVERVNLMTGMKYMEPEDTPLVCSPASETYWSM